MTDDLSARLIALRDRIEARRAKARAPQMGTCSVCGHQQEMLPSWQPTAHSMIQESWRCQQCQGQITVTFTTVANARTAEDDLDDVLEFVIALRDHLEKLPRYRANDFTIRHRDVVLASDLDGLITITRVPPTKGFCPVRPALDGSQGNPMQVCTFEEGHPGPHSWEGGLITALRQDPRAETEHEDHTRGDGSCSTDGRELPQRPTELASTPVENDE